MAKPSLWDNIQWDQATFGGISASGAVQVQDLIYAALRKAAITLGPQRTASPVYVEWEGVTAPSKLAAHERFYLAGISSHGSMTVLMPEGPYDHDVTRTWNGLPLEQQILRMVRFSVINQAA